MAKLVKQRVTSVKHWNDTLFSFTTTRNGSFRFENGHFVMVGLEVDNKPLMRAYSIVSSNYEDHLEFFSIKVANGPLTSRLAKISVDDEIMLSEKPTGTLIQEHLSAGRNLYLISTGTGLAPFLSIIKNPQLYDRFDKIILTHGTRLVSELAYRDVITNELPNNEFFGEQVQKQLLYYPTVTREDFRNQGRVTDLLASGKLADDLGLAPIDPVYDRFMVCGSPAMLSDVCDILKAKGFSESRNGYLGEYVIERAFVTQ